MSLTEEEFKPVHEEDIQSVMDLELSMPDSPFWAAASKDEQLAIIRNGNMFGIYEEGALIGKVGFWNSPDDGWEVDGMIVQQALRNKKYGTRLFDYAIKQILTNVHPERLTLYTHPHNTAAILMYLRGGFVITDYIRDKYGPGKHRIQMTMFL